MASSVRIHPVANFLAVKLLLGHLEISSTPFTVPRIGVGVQIDRSPTRASILIVSASLRLARLGVRLPVSEVYFFFVLGSLVVCFRYETTDTDGMGPWSPPMLV